MTPITSPYSPRNERGATMIEYSLLVALLALVLVSSVSAMQTKIGDKFDNASYHIQAAISGVQP